MIARNLWKLRGQSGPDYNGRKHKQKHVQSGRVNHVMEKVSRSIWFTVNPRLHRITITEVVTQTTRNSELLMQNGDVSTCFWLVRRTLNRARIAQTDSLGICTGDQRQVYEEHGDEDEEEEKGRRDEKEDEKERKCTAI